VRRSQSCLSLLPYGYCASRIVRPSTERVVWYLAFRPLMNEIHASMENMLWPLCVEFARVQNHASMYYRFHSAGAGSGQTSQANDGFTISQSSSSQVQKQACNFLFLIITHTGMALSYRRWLREWITIRTEWQVTFVSAAHWQSCERSAATLSCANRAGIIVQNNMDSFMNNSCS
jgi:hypothetical protein